MDNSLNIFGKSPEPSIYAKFFLENGDFIVIEGNSVVFIFFELNRRFPDRFNYVSVAFSGKDEEESRKNLETFFLLSKKFG
jgi:hypothetical protein